jgi:hypothetical protein
MGTRYYRMSSLPMAQAVLRRLAEDSRFHPSRPLGYAHLKIVRVDSADHCNPDALVLAVDAMARPVSRPSDWAGLSVG